MSMDLPPPQIPVSIPVQRMQISSHKRSIQFGVYHLYLMGFESFSESDINHLVDHPTSAESVIRYLSNELYRKGFITSRVMYAVKGSDLYVMAVNKSVRSIKGPSDLVKFFSGLSQDKPFAISKFEASRALASAYADRIGLSVQTRFVDVSDTQVDLELKTSSIPTGSFSGSLSLGNAGSRYSGRNLLDATLKSASRGGLEASVNAQTSIFESKTELNAGSYKNIAARLDQISSIGSFGLGARITSFSIDNTPVPYSGRYNDFSIDWSNVVSATLSSRSLLNIKAGLSNRESSIESSGQTFFEEKYTYIDVTPSYVTSWANNRLTTSVQISGGRAQSLLNSYATDGYFVIRPIARYVRKHNNDYSFTAVVAGQWANAAIPEFQQWTLGGADALSAYLPSTYYGDAGYLIRLSEKRTIEFAKNCSIAGEVFVETGNVTTNDPKNMNTSTGKPSDYGIGISFQAYEHLSIKLSSAKAFNENSNTKDSKANFYATATLSF